MAPLEIDEIVSCQPVRDFVHFPMSGKTFTWCSIVPCQHVRDFVHFPISGKTFTWCSIVHFIVLVASFFTKYHQRCKVFMFVLLKLHSFAGLLSIIKSDILVMEFAISQLCMYGNKPTSTEVNILRAKLRGIARMVATIPALGSRVL